MNLYDTMEKDAKYQMHDGPSFASSFLIKAYLAVLIFIIAVSSFYRLFIHLEEIIASSNEREEHARGYDVGKFIMRKFAIILFTLSTSYCPARGMQIITIPLCII